MVREPTYKILWKRKGKKELDVTKDLAPFLTRLTFTDKEEGEADELTLTLDDGSGQWRNVDYPNKGDQLTAWIGWVNEELTPIGIFQIDQIKVTQGQSGDFITIQALSIIIDAPIKTKQRKIWSNITLKGLANAVAADSGMTVSGINEDITLPGVSQHKTTGLSFLRGVALQYGYVFTIKNKKLWFIKQGTLQTRKSAGRYDKSYFVQAETTDATDLEFKNARHTYWDPNKKKKVSTKLQDNEAATRTDVLELDGFVHNEQQSDMKVRAAWLKMNNGSVTGTLDFAIGVSNFLAGNNIELIGRGKHSGLFHISNTTHIVEPGSGARLSGEIFKVGEIDKSLY